MELFETFLSLLLHGSSTFLLFITGLAEIPRLELVEAFVEHMSQRSSWLVDGRIFESVEIARDLGDHSITWSFDVIRDVIHAICEVLLLRVLILMGAKSGRCGHPTSHGVEDVFIFVVRDTAPASFNTVLSFNKRPPLQLLSPRRVMNAFTFKVGRRKEFPLLILALLPVVIEEGVRLLLELLFLTGRADSLHQIGMKLHGSVSSEQGR